MPPRIPFPDKLPSKPETPAPLSPKAREQFLRGAPASKIEAWWRDAPPAFEMPKLDPARKQKQAHCIECLLDFPRYEGTKTVNCPQCGLEWDRKTGRKLAWHFKGVTVVIGRHDVSKKQCLLPFKETSHDIKREKVKDRTPAAPLGRVRRKRKGR